MAGDPRESVNERIERLRVHYGMPTDWLAFTLRTAETIVRQRAMLDINTRTMTRMATVHSMDLVRIKKLDAALKRAAEFLVKLDLAPGAADEVLRTIREARDP